MSPVEGAPAPHPARAPPDKRAARGAVTFLLIVICVATASFFLHIRYAGVFACPPPGPDDDQYLGYCNSSAFGDYDHGAFWFELEEAAIVNAAAADVLFLGSSKLQFAFSSPALRGWFSEHGARSYLLGFSHFENASFLGPLLHRLRPHARAYVINLDNFFASEETNIGQFVMRDRTARRRYEGKRAWLAAQERVCQLAPAMCGSDAFAYYRQRDSGEWRLGGSSASLTPESVGAEERPDSHLVAEQEKVAATFLRTLSASQDCIIFTYVPASKNERQTAAEIAARLGYRFVSPSLEDLDTFDGSHLDAPSSERFSQAFFKEAGPQLQRCLSGPSTPVTQQ